MSSDPKSPNPPEVKSSRQLQVLVVQSNPADTLLTIEAFKAAGLTDGLQCVPAGKDAVSYVKRQGQYASAPTPDLIFLDLSQPNVSALSILRVIKSRPALMHTPIVVAAGSDDPNFARSVYALNGNCLIQKPGELAEFVHFIKKCYQFWSAVITLAPPRVLNAKKTESLADQQQPEAKPRHRSRRKDDRNNFAHSSSVTL
jgi:chemotaxis family two-component system response regulator Rcp1